MGRQIEKYPEEVKIAQRGKGRLWERYYFIVFFKLNMFLFKGKADYCGK